MHWKHIGRFAGILIVSGSFVSANAALIVGSAAASDPVVQMVAATNAMHDAETIARRYLNHFLALKMDHTGSSKPDASLKIAIPSRGGGDEVIWVASFVRDGARFIGTPVMTSQYPSDQSSGNIVKFSDAQIRDWSFLGQDGKLYGNYTTRALLPRLTSGQASQISAILSTYPTPADW